MVKRILVIIISLLFILLPQKVLAANEFSTSYDVNYEVGVDGVTEVTEKVSLKNLTNTYYASSFTMTIGSTTLTDVIATDTDGALSSTVEDKDNQTLINVKLNQQITGIDKKQSFTLKYKSKDFAQSIGKTWEVNLPRIHEKSDIELFNVTLSVPLSFGEPTSITPKPTSEADSAGKITFRFNKEQLVNSGVSVNFGTNQVFDFNLKYELDNSSFFPAVTSITLPPDTNYQDVTITNIYPAPINVTRDKDGNYLAWFEIPKRTKQQIQVNGLVKLYINPKPGDFVKLSGDQQLAWTKSDHYWEANDANIKAVLTGIFQKEQVNSTREKVQLIYQYVVNTLKYDSLRLGNLERMGAVTALSNRDKAVCMEFTDLFIALTRGMGIPAREMDGYAYSQNKKLRPLSLGENLLHAWPEYFDEKKGWVMVDPTWENTSGGVDYFNKFDLNHIVLAIKGVSSVDPQTTDNVTATISSSEFKPISKPEVEILMNDNLWAGLPASAEIKISNKGSSLLDISDLDITASKIKILNSESVSVSVIPPLGNATYKIDLKPPFLWQTVSDQIIVNYRGQRYIREIIIKPFFLYFPIPYVIIALTAVLGLGYLVILGLHFRFETASKQLEKSPKAV